MAESAGGAREGQRSSWRALRAFGFLGILVAILLIVFVVVVLSRSRGGQSERSIDVNNLAQVLRYGDLPQTFLFGGMVWQAVEARRIGGRPPLVRVGSSVDGRPLFTERGQPSNPYRSLYMPLARSGPYADVFVRCNPGGTTPPAP